jgi:hypothetical protein
MIWILEWSSPETRAWTRRPLTAKGSLSSRVDWSPRCSRVDLGVESTKLVDVT